MKTKLKIVIALFLVAIGLYSCSDIYDSIDLNAANSRIIVSSQMDYGNKIRVGSHETFGDISAGVESRLWTFPEGVVDIVDSDNDVTSTEQNVKAIFNVVGKHEVKLHQVFKGEAYTTGSTNPVAKVLDTTIVVTVLAPISIVVKANYLNTDGTLGAELNVVNGAKNEVLAGRTIRYTLITEGEPEAYLWTIDGGDPATSTTDTKTVDVRYKKLGTFGFTIKANTPRPFGEATVMLKDFINVIPSTDPVTMDDAQVIDDQGNIALNYSREMNAETLKASDFSVTLKNKSGATLPVTISSATISPTEGNIVLLKLAGQTLYNDDIITVSYTKGSLTTADAVFASSFTDVAVSFKSVNILASTTFDYGFETSTSADWVYLGWGAPWNKFTSAVTSTKAHGGKKSLSVQIDARGGMILGYNHGGDKGTFRLTAGKTYSMGSWVYVESLGDKASVPDLRLYFTPNTDWGIGPNPGFSADFAVGKWVYSSALVKINTTADYSFMLRSDNQGNSSALKFYIDDITVSEAKLRP
ncbi:hypothetical protein NYQ10_21030 [Flavobacterium johnsoniae]|uniref:hypothetical protein n=1 Tax=Flavobacterium TaxID=237 RepID=UPI0023E3660D|nr:MULTISPECIES: hypothetical protein [Flavobacterium]WET04082.1 hypothetical protein P0R33_07000 [Flavobacterium sp. YJ01]WJS94568.1 hypothetical protein NYQ10_21030 [Flavobacterium johnsoniae]